MALSSNPETFDRSPEQGATAGHDATISHLKHPLTIYDVGVRSVVSDSLKSGSGQFGTWKLETWEMDDDTRYQVCSIDPVRRRTNVAVATGTPWGTQIEGMNMHAGIDMAHHGLPVIIVGPEMNASLPISQSAHNQLQIINRIEDTGFSEPKVSIFKGFSRQAMIMFGLFAYSPSDERQVLYGEAVDPCLAVPLKDMVSELDPRGIIETLEYSAQEIIGSLHLVASILRDPRRRRHYTHTVDASIDGLRQFIRTGKPLFSGEAGELALHVPTDAHMNIGFLLTSLANQKDKFEQRLTDHPNVTYSDYEGCHTQGVRRRIMQDTSRRLSGLTLQLSLGVPYDEIDYTLINLPAERP